MSSGRTAALVLLFLASPTLAQDAPRPPAVERALAIQQAMTQAKQLLAEHQPAQAAAVLEALLERADGNRAFLGLLRDAYGAELESLRHMPAADPARLARVRERFTLLGGTAPAAPEAKPEVGANNPFRAPASKTEAGPETTRNAAEAFKLGHYAEAARLFADAARTSALSTDENAAWAYCRIKTAAEKLNSPNLSSPAILGLEREVTEALSLAPANAKLQELGQTLIASARKRRGASDPTPALTPALATNSPGWDTVESASFRIRHQGNAKAAEEVARAAEAKRKETFERWSGPVSGNWSPKCEITLYPTAEEYARATGRPAGGIGHATVRFTNGKIAERRIDLRADDISFAADVLPRELTHVALADLFPSQPPPRWAEAGMAVLSATPAEVGRYARTLHRCVEKNDLVPVAKLLEMKDFPTADKITGFYCASVSLVDYLVRLRGEKNFTIFLRDAQRYGISPALKKTYGIDGAAALEQHWRRYALSQARGQ